MPDVESTRNDGLTSGIDHRPPRNSGGVTGRTGTIRGETFTDPDGGRSA